MVAITLDDGPYAFSFLSSRIGPPDGLDPDAGHGSPKATLMDASASEGMAAVPAAAAPIRRRRFLREMLISAIE
jgi:hypothetical protein